MHVSAICCLSNHGFGIELFHNSRLFALFLNSINDYQIYHLLPEKQSPLSCLTSRTSGQKNGARPQFENGARPQFEPVPFFSRMEKTQQDCPISAQGEAGISDNIFFRVYV
jgi:hypothetical protein